MRYLLTVEATYRLESDQLIDIMARVNNTARPEGARVMAAMELAERWGKLVYVKMSTADSPPELDRELEGVLKPRSV